MRTAPISSATPERALASTERVTGSSFPLLLIVFPLLLIVLLQDQVAHLVHRPPPAGAHDASGFGELHYRRSLDLRACAHSVSLEYRNLSPLAVEVGLAASGLHVAFGLRLPELGLLHRNGRREPQVDQLDGLLLHAVPVAAFVGGVKPFRQLPQVVG